ncbi:MAG: glycosyltransferase [Clostridiales bacterium]|nr:glycosyltransferase [Clostridiales bacterium]
MSNYVDGLVSVVIPTFNSENYIGNAIDSVLAQTYKNYEIICVDDCSEDSTADKLKEYSAAHEGITFEVLEVNSGAAVARNRALNMAKGRYIAFLDSDDTWEPDKLEKQLAIITQGKYAFVYCSYNYVDTDGKPVSEKCRIKEVAEYKDLLTRTYISTPTVIYDRNFYGDVKMPPRRTGQDYGFWLKLLRQGQAYGIDEVLVHVTKRESSLSKSKLQSLRDVYETQTEFEKISSPRAAIHTMRYFAYAVKKKFDMGLIF